MEVRVLPGVGNNLHVEVPLVDARHGQADAVHRDRSLAHDVGGEQGRKPDREPEGVAVGADVLDGARRVDVPLDEVAAEPRIRAQRPLQVDENAPPQRAEALTRAVSGESPA